GAVIQFMVEGRVRVLLGRRRLDRKISRLKSHYIVCGYGRIGKVICHKLLRENYSVVVIDKNPDLSATLDGLGFVYVCGDATDESVLLKAGIHHAKALIAALGTDTENVFLVLTGRQLAPKLNIIARTGSEAAKAKLMAAGANIVDAQIYTTTDGRALDTISVSREFDREEDEERRADRIADSIEKALRGELRLPDVVARRKPKGRIRAFALEPEVNINNQWSHRYTMVEISGLDRPGLLYDLTATLSKLNLNIASAHVATFGERVVDVFYVTDLMGAQITSPTRQAAIKRALIALFKAAEKENRKAG
ncbi:MAG: NAD-binding protein, partial [Pseudolabrys sp.]